MPELDVGPSATLSQPVDREPALDRSQPSPLSSEPTINQTLRGSFGTLYNAPDVAQANYQSLSQFAGSSAANDLLIAGGAAGAERLGPLNTNLTEAQREAVPAVLGRALGDFALEQEGAVSRIVPGAQILRDVQGVPVVMAAYGPEQTAAQSQGQSLEALQWVAGVGMEARGQYGFVSGSLVAGIVFDEDGTFGSFAAVGAGPGVGAGAVVGPTGFAVVGPEEITDIGGLGVQFGGFAAAGEAIDLGMTVPLSGNGQIAGAGVTFPMGPAAGVGVGAYSEVGYTRVTRLFEMSDLQSRGGAVLEDLSGTPKRAIDGMMAGLGIGSYDEMASFLLRTQASVDRQIRDISARQ